MNWVAYSECYKYETTASEWKSLEDMPARTERGSACVGVYGEMIYLAGGISTSDQISRFSNHGNSFQYYLGILA